MSNMEVPLTPEQKLLHAIFAPSDDAQRLADKTDFVFDQIRHRLLASRSGSPPFANRIEACGMVRACLDRMLNVVHHDVKQFFNADNLETSTFNEVIGDYAVDLAAIACRMLIDLDFSDPVRIPANSV